MGVSPAIFESAGQRSEHYVPGVYGRSFNVSSPSGISAGNLCIMGKSNGGEPYKMLEFGSLADAKQALVGGELLDAIAYCKRNNCALVIAKLDRLARDVEFCFRVVNTGIEIHFCDMPQINTLLLGVFASVAQYERELTSDRTKKALAAKKERGEATGGASEKWREAFNSKPREDFEMEMRKRGETKNRRHIESRDVQAFLRILKNVFPLATAGDNPCDWDWDNIGTKEGAKQKIIALIIDYRNIDPTLFAKWDFSDLESYSLRIKVASYICNLRKALYKYYGYEGK